MLATSDGSPSRRSAIVRRQNCVMASAFGDVALISCQICVLVRPGQTAFTRILCAPSSMASDLVICETPPFAAAYGPAAGSVATECTDEIFTIHPPRPSRTNCSTAYL